MSLRMNGGWRIAGICLATIALATACISGGDDDSSGGASCQDACEHYLNVCGHGDGSTSELADCITDCEDEPWPQNYIDCRTQTCKSEGECENY